MRWKLDDERPPGVDMAPMIDCVFLLLIFFLVGTMMKKRDQNIDVKLPSSTTAQSVTPDNAVSAIGINREGELFWEGAPVTANELHQRLQQVAETTPTRRLRLDCDRATPFLRVAEVLDMCAFRGLRNVGVQTAGTGEGGAQGP